jgi:hypothetical protein
MSRTLGDFQRQWEIKQSNLPGIVPAQAPHLPLQASGAGQGPNIHEDERQRRAGLHVGDVVWCTDLAGLFRRCRCGHAKFLVYPGMGPHAAQLRCAACDLGGRWVPKHRLAETAS